MLGVISPFSDICGFWCDTFDESSPCILAATSLSNSTARHARLDALYTSNVSCRVEMWRAKWNLGYILLCGHYSASRTCAERKLIILRSRVIVVSRLWHSGLQGGNPDRVISEPSGVNYAVISEWWTVVNMRQCRTLFRLFRSRASRTNWV